jgi:hypothetical protein
MTVHVSVRSISASLLLSVSLLGLSGHALAPSVVARQKAAPTLAERLDRLGPEFDRPRTDLHVPGAVLAIGRGDAVIFQVEHVEVGVELAPDTFTLQPSTELGRGK